ncbi:flagellin [Nitrosopumilus sp. b1]|uniref:archaellin/type IV pilin N-terminal domain-containing protein n=1 Tax=Nitrosopumilus sp. b1 TaxID=2109907 RepID=UPI0015F6D11A|nr:archaellin/type IV pilin N-terminal domain-containing protein [Nitrosopumilus sp. b1]KAF6243100.1 flagellin [Nitrosopumilus sp. b1]
MNLIRKGHGHTHRGVIGVESAIVMIAFVIVAAALAFVVLNMGFATTQKAKTSIISGLNEASSSLEIAGKVTGIGNVVTGQLEVISVPLKIASGGDSVNLQNTTASVKYLSNTVEYDNILVGTASTSTNAANVTEGWELALRHFGTVVPDNPVNGTWSGATKAIFYWTVGAGNQILDEGEHAVLSIAFDQAGPDDRPSALDRIRAEILLPTGAPLTIERDVPSITNTVVDLG